MAQAFFTGDSSGWIINDFLHNLPNPHQPKPRLSVYKIQHHGSGIDCRDQEPHDNIKLVFIKATSILAFLEFNEVDGVTYDFLTRYVEQEKVLIDYDRDPKQVQDCILAAFRRALENANLSFRDAKEWFRKKHKNNMNTVLGAMSGIPNLNENQENKLVNYVFRTVWDTAYATRSQTLSSEETEEQAKKRISQREFFFINPPYWQNWWLQWMSDDTGKRNLNNTVWFYFWAAYGGGRSIAEFFSSFEADAYVVSANYAQHGHPHPSTVFGLAWALYDQKRQAELFVTSGYSIYINELVRLAAAIAPLYNKDPQTMAAALFYRTTNPQNNEGTGCLKIRSMSERATYMTIGLHPESQRFLNNGGSRAVFGTTDIMDFRTYEPERPKEVHDLMEKKQPCDRDATAAGGTRRPSSATRSTRRTPSSPTRPQTWPERQVSAAWLVLSPPSKAPIIIDGDELNVTHAVVSLSSTVDRSLTAVMFIRTQDDTLLRATQSIPHVKDLPSLAKVLINQLGLLTLPALLAIVLRDPERALHILSYRIPTVLQKAGILGLAPDLYNSTAKARIGITRKLCLEEVTIVCKLATVAGAGEWKPALKLGPIDVRLESVVVVITNAGLKTETVIIRGTIKIGEQGIKATLETTLRSSKEEATIQLTLSGTEGLSDACKLLPGAPDLASQDVPLSRGKALTNGGPSPGEPAPPNPGGIGNQALQKLGSLEMTTVGITVSQTAAGMNSYSIKNVFAAVKLQGWETYLPEKFAEKLPKDLLDKTTVRVMVLDPLTDSRDVAVRISTEMTVALKERSEALDVEFSAAPLVERGDYEYRLYVAGRQKGLSMWDVVDKVAMSVGKEDLTSGAPILEQVLDLVFFKTISVAVVDSKDGAAFGDWSLQFGVPSLNTLPSGNIQVRGVEVTLTKTFNKVNAVVSGVVYSPKSSVAARITLKTPTTDLPGSIQVDCSRALAFQDIYDALELPDISDVSLIREVLHVGLTSAYFAVANTKVDNQSRLRITHASCAFGYDELDLGILMLTSLAVSTRYTQAEKDGDPARHGFTVEPSLADDSVRARLSYDAPEKKISAELLPLKDVYIASVADLLLPENLRQYNVLHDVLGGLGLDRAAMDMDVASGYTITKFLLEVSQKEKMAVGGSSLQLEQLKIAYLNETKPDGSATDPAAGGDPLVKEDPKKQPQDDQKKPSDEDSKKPINDAPKTPATDDPKKPTEDDTKKTNHRCSKESQGRTEKDPKNHRQDNKRNICQSRTSASSIPRRLAKAQHSSRAYSPLHFEIGKKFSFMVAYLRHSKLGTDAFSGTTKDKLPSGLGFSDLSSAVGMPASIYQLPKNQVGNWDIQGITAVFIPNKYFEVRGRVSAEWKDDIGGIDISLERLEGVLRVDSRGKEEEAEKTRSYQVWLTGKTAYQREGSKLHQSRD
ncbi:hypothetical protein B0T25DRAFT_513751 [Lasiosphaeria hispida]|uniref:Uncharacterized protein n=1 Tax=Lasiosphaeria hispida TaxID=260671 RepID=A0AAJ0HW95_9PEZI|nr:hypothetical protein B0T25DRAFT_513751 [Lasiosphaeria hispida]